MKKRSILALLLLVAVLMQYCKKSSDDTTVAGTAVVFQAYVNNVVWTPTTTTTTLTYNAAAKTKVFTFTADSAKDRIVVTNKITTNVGPGAGIPIQNYLLDTVTQKVSMAYYKLANGVATGVGSTRSGYINVSSIDSVNHFITGTFGFTETKLNYDSNGKVTSITSTGITAGQFNSLPYTYIKQ